MKVRLSLKDAKITRTSGLTCVDCLTSSAGNYFTLDGVTRCERCFRKYVLKKLESLKATSKSANEAQVS